MVSCYLLPLSPLVTKNQNLWPTVIQYAPMYNTHPIFFYHNLEKTGFVQTKPVVDLCEIMCWKKNGSRREVDPPGITTIPLLCEHSRSLKQAFIGVWILVLVIKFNWLGCLVGNATNSVHPNPLYIISSKMTIWFEQHCQDCLECITKKQALWFFCKRSFFYFKLSDSWSHGLD